MVKGSAREESSAPPGSRAPSMEWAVFRSASRNFWLASAEIIFDQFLKRGLFFDVLVRSRQ